MVDCKIIAQPAVDLAAFMSVANMATGRNVSATTDTIRREMTDAEKFLRCFADAAPPVGQKRDCPEWLGLLAHVHYSVLFATEDLAPFLLTAGKLAVGPIENRSGYTFGVVSGSLADFYMAIDIGRANELWQKIRLAFESLGFQLWRFPVPVHLEQV